MNLHFPDSAPAKTGCFDSVEGLERRWPAILKLPNGPTCVQFARTKGELEQIGRLRYQRLVVDQGQPYEPVAGNDTLLIDPIDRLSLNLFVSSNAKVSMALRMSWSTDVAPSDYLILLQQSLPKDIARARTIISSRLIASTSCRGDLANLVILFRRAFEVGVSSDCAYSVLSTLPHRMPLFEKLGYRPPGIRLEDPIAGSQAVLMLDLRDIAHMEAVGSPFARTWRQSKAHSST